MQVSKHDCEYHPAPFIQARQVFGDNGSRYLDLNRGIFLNDSNGPTQNMSSKCWSPTEMSERRSERYYPQSIGRRILRNIIKYILESLLCWADWITCGGLYDSVRPQGGQQGGSQLGRVRGTIT